jgi:predicted metal-binding membrane protein
VRDSVFLSAMDRALPVVLRTDASTKACGFELVNIGKDGNDIPILFGSHKLSPRASDWHTIEQEAYAILWSVLCCADMLNGIAFVIETDHRNLQWMNRSTNKIVLNWALHLQNFVFTVRHIPGVTNSVADALSRLPQYDADVKGLSVSAASNSKAKSNGIVSPVSH